MSVTAVLITREKEWPKDAAIDFSFFDEVLIETSCVGVWKRFELAMRAKSEHIYMQDDDCIVHFPTLFQRYDGLHITNAMTLQHFQEYYGTGETLIGWGSFFPRWRVDFTRWQQRYGDLYLDQAPERIFTLLNPPHHSVVMPIWHIDRPVKMWKQPGHFERRAHIRELFKEL